jgi:HlyD family secretion protein
MRRLLPILLALGVLGAFGWTLVFLYRKSKVEPVVYQTAKAEVRDIVHKTVAAGAIVPRREVSIKPRVSGIVQRLMVEPGQLVRAGDLIAEIKIVPNVVNLNAAESRLEAATINLKNRQREFERVSGLRQQQIASEVDMSQNQLQLELAQQEVQSAKNNLQLIKEGAIAGSGKVSNLVTSTVEGMAIEVPVKEGASVIETNNFNEGTTIASIADMQDMIFQGFVDESEVGKVKENMPVSISIGALVGQKFNGTLEYIAPKGTNHEGTIEFEVRAALHLSHEGPSEKIPPSFVRANYSANADIILERRDQVLAINERLLQFDAGKPFVEVRNGSQGYDKRPVELGLSDGVVVEVLRGVDAADVIKVPIAVSATPPG